MTREDLLVAVGAVLFNVSNYPKPVQARILGQDTRPLTEKVVDAVLALLAARGDAATTEPRWGWDLGPDDPRGVRTEQDEAKARYEVERFPRDRRLMRREVTAWREVQP